MYEKMEMYKYLSLINLNVNGLNALIKRHRVGEWIRKHNPERIRKYAAYKKPSSEQKT